MVAHLKIFAAIIYCVSAFFININAQSFIDVSEEAGLPILSGLGYSGIWIDYNNDDWLDILCYSQTTYLFKNNGDGTFTEVTSESGVSGVSPNSYSVADFNNDGWDDLLVKTNSGELLILQNNKGVFEEYLSLAENVTRAVWLDYNGDGWLDIFATRFNKGPLVFQNIGENIFKDISVEMNLPQSKGETLSVGDFNNNGFPDVYIGVYSSGNRLLKNIAGSYFENIPPSSGVSDFRNTVSVSWGDFNEDGFLDLYNANIASNRNVLFKNNGNETFTDITVAAGVEDVGDARTATFVDYNNNGYLDIFTTNHVNINRLYKNNGDETYSDVTYQSNIAFPTDGFGVSWGDYDNDGDLDVIIVSHESRTLNLFRNDGGNENNWLFVKLQGSFDNRSGIGARVRLFFQDRVLLKENNAGCGKNGQNAPYLHFGVGSSTMVDSIDVKWASGMLQKLYNIPVNQKITIEQQGNVPPIPFRLNLPENQSVQTSDTLNFRWSASADPDSNKQVQYSLFLKNEIGETIFNTNSSDTSIVLEIKSIVPMGATVTWFVEASDGNSERNSWDTFSFSYDPIVGIKDLQNEIIDSFRLYKNYPNPFNPKTNIKFELLRPASVTINIYNSLGMLIRNLVYGEFNSGSYEVEWDGLTNNGNPAANGIYLLKAMISTFDTQQEISSKTLKMVLIK